jgi:four helix bundle protein
MDGGSSGVRKRKQPEDPVILPISEVKKLSYIVAASRFAQEVSDFLGTLNKADFFGDEVSQLSRASTSVGANLYEGLGRGNDSLYFLNHVRMAAGSAYECVFWIQQTGGPDSLVETCERLCDVLKQVADKERSEYPLRKDEVARLKKKRKREEETDGIDVKSTDV